MEISEILVKALNMGASDVHITVNLPVMVRINGNLQALGDHILTPEETFEYAKSITNEAQLKEVDEKGQADFPLLSSMSAVSVSTYSNREEVTPSPHGSSNPAYPASRL